MRARKIVLVLLGIISGIVLLLIVGIKLFLTDERLRAAIEPVLEEQLGRDVSIGGFETSLFRSFPSLAIGASNLAIHTPNAGGQSRPDLARLDRLWIEISLIPLLQSNVHIKAIELEKPQVLVEVYDDLSSNLIELGEERGGAEESPVSESSIHEIAIERSVITDGLIAYSHADGTLLTIGDLDASLTATLRDLASLAGRVEAGNTYLEMGGIPYVNGIDLALEVVGQANLDSSWVHLDRVDLVLSSLLLEASGEIRDWDSDRIGVDLTIEAPEASIEGIWSLLPASVVKTVEGLSGKGDVSVLATLKGVIAEEEMPALHAALSVADGEIQYPGLPSAIQNIHLDAVITEKGVEVEQLHAIGAGASVDLSGTLADYANPILNGKVALNADLSRVASFYPLDDGTSLSGEISVDAQVTGPLAAPAEFGASGNAQLANINYHSASLEQPIEQVSGALNFNNNRVDVNRLTFKSGQSDVLFTGAIENYISLMAENMDEAHEATVTGRVRSDYLNVSEQLSDDTTDTGPLILPDINMALTFEADAMEYDGITLTNANGSLGLDEGVFRFDGGRAGFMDGLLRASGTFDLSNPARPVFSGTLGVDQARASRFFTSFEQLNSIARIGSFLDGFFDSEATINLTMDEDFNPDMTSLLAEGIFGATGGALKGMPLQEKLANLIGISALKTLDIGKWTHTFNISGERLHIQSLDFTAGDFTFALNGSQGFDGTMDYMLSVGLPQSASAVLKTKSQFATIALADPATGRITLDFLATGTFVDPVLNLNSEMIRTRLAARASAVASEARADAQARLDSLENAARMRAEAEFEAQRKALEEKAKEKAQAEAGRLLGGIIDSSAVATEVDSLKEEAGEVLKNRLKGLLNRKKNN